MKGNSNGFEPSDSAESECSDCESEGLDRTLSSGGKSQSCTDDDCENELSHASLRKDTSHGSRRYGKQRYGCFQIYPSSNDESDVDESNVNESDVAKSDVDESEFVESEVDESDNSSRTLTRNRPIHRVKNLRQRL